MWTIVLVVTIFFLFLSEQNQQLHAYLQTYAIPLRSTRLYAIATTTAPSTTTSTNGISGSSFSPSPSSASSASTSLALGNTESIDSTTSNTEREELSSAERIARAISFYSAAVPIFVSYKSLFYYLNFKKQVLQDETITPEEETKLYDLLHEWGSDKIVQKINQLKGFYVKTGQIISTRVDIFPKQYTDKLAITQDKLDPLPGYVIKQIVSKELLQGAPLSELFASFDDMPLGSASIAQVHRATLLDGRVVAVKVQRPGIGKKLLGDIRNLKNFAKLIGNSLLIDYYKIFCELERTLQYELDFLYEAQNAVKVASSVAHSPSNKRHTAPVVVPLPIPGLVSKKVLVMEYVDGKALSQIAAEMSNTGVQPGSDEALLLGSKLLSALTDAYGSMIFGSGIIHGDPHPGNIFILEEGAVALLDCGQVKEINTAQRLGFAKLIIKVNQWEGINRQLGNVRTLPPTFIPPSPEESKALNMERNRLTSDIAEMVRSFGITFKEGAGDDCAAAVAILLFGNTDTILPGGYAGEEISLDSPIVQVAEFPSELILLGRATVMIKGIANRLGIKWGLSDRWTKLAKEAVDTCDRPDSVMPVWSVSTPTISSPETSVLGSSGASNGSMKKGDKGSSGVRFKDIVKAMRSVVLLIKEYINRKVIFFVRNNLPKPVREWLYKMMVKFSGVSKS